MVGDVERIWFDRRCGSEHANKSAETQQEKSSGETAEVFAFSAQPVWKYGQSKTLEVSIQGSHTCFMQTP